ncbi:hypothetical protein SEMRO_2484_G328960.1 [Seminavis robusta]|uniref:Uncharacterized protein n=1 Tax=Seminavis robusta TaxID=568900 RepID=A0A9N8F0N0_9STRA|nr:hypothetical protein SEMRO_2484_G328960.1 [Seminavis robusta]|eukprot:Sro2484_g328960.1 n/a (248) ;mRNA; r:1518-2261
MSNNMNVSSILEVNSQSIEHLRAGRFSEANEGLGQVLEGMKRYIQSSGPSESTDLGGNAMISEQQQPGKAAVAATAPFVLRTEDVPVRTGDTAKDEVLSLFARAFSVPVLPMTKGEKAASLMAFVYNLAFARHSEALATQDNVLSRALLGQAGKLYQTALRVASSHLEDEQSLDGFPCLLLATANNYAHVFVEQFDAQEAGKGVSMLHSLMKEPSVLREMPEEDYSFFESNVINFLESPLFSIAPAA